MKRNNAKQLAVMHGNNDNEKSDNSSNVGNSNTLNGNTTNRWQAKRRVKKRRFNGILKQPCCRVASMVMIALCLGAIGYLLLSQFIQIVASNTLSKQEQTDTEIESETETNVSSNKEGANSAHLRASTVQSIAPESNTSTQQFQLRTLDAPSCDIPLRPSEIDFTLVTQLSMDRLWMIQYHCRRWNTEQHHMSIAILTNQTIQQIQGALLGMDCYLPHMTIQLLDPANFDDADYPVNLLRTMALSKVKTSHVMYVDVDFWESNDLHDTLMMERVRIELAKDSKLALVIPAFQLFRQCHEYRDCREKNIPRMPQTKSELMDAIVHKHRASPFDPTNLGGHGSTRYHKWSADQSAGDLYDLPCLQSHRYEPYLAFRYCHDLPPFQLGFTGYGKNKMTWVMQLVRSGYLLSQLGGAFVVHYPHLDSNSRMEWNEAPKALYYRKKGDERKLYKRKPQDVHNVDWNRYKRGRVDALFVEFRNWLEEEVEDRSRMVTCDNALDDDERLWIDRE